MKSTEQRINHIRNKLVAASLELAEFQANSYGGSPELDDVGQKIEDVIIEFERVVNEIPVEAL